MKLFICLFTYASTKDDPRANYAYLTLESALTRLKWSGETSVHIADDGSFPGHVRALELFAGGYGHVHGISSTNAERGGYGRSYNLATQHVHAYEPDVILPLEDDWVLNPNRMLGMDALAADLLGDERIDCIRLGYLGFTKPIRGEVITTGRNLYLLLDPQSEERHIFAGHPRLETVAFERRVGPWPEGLGAGTTEFEVAGRIESRWGVAWPLSIGPGDLFSHVGAVQARTDQKARA